MSELKPCLCGSGKPMYFEMSNSRSSFVGHIVFCPKCKKGVKGLSKGIVIEKWNRRADNE